MPEDNWGACIVPPVPNSPAMEEAKRRLGQLPPSFTYLAHSDWLTRFHIAAGEQKVAYIPHRLLNLITLTVSQETSCRYCVGLTRFFLKITGFADDHIDALEAELHGARQDPRERAALDFARRLARCQTRPHDDLDALRRAGYTEDEIAEISLAVAYSVIMTRVATILAFPLDSVAAMERNILIRIMRPLIRSMMRRRLVPSAPVPLPTGASPVEALTGALRGSAGGPALLEAFRGAMDSKVISRRSKLLSLAVIARGLGCPCGDAHSRDELRADGFDDAEIDRTIASLGHERLDPIESRIVPFARETCHYQQTRIQKLSGELATHLTPAQVVETVGIAALANGLCRLSILTERG